MAATMSEHGTAKTEELVKDPSESKYAMKSFGVFPLTWKPRQVAIHVMDHPYVDFLMLAIIIANVLLLSLYDPIDLAAPENVAIRKSEIFFLVVYTVEMAMKMFAYGVFWEAKTGTYFKSGWNIIDFVVVVLAFVSYLGDSLGTASSFGTTLRLIRILRPLRRTKAAPTLSWVTRALLRAVPQLASGGVLFLLLVIISDIIGMTFFRGTLRQRCVYNNDPTQIIPEDLEKNRFCALDSQPFGRRCPYANSTCMDVGFNPNNNVTSFDDAISTGILLFQLITMEGWSDLMYWTTDANGDGAHVYYIIIVVLGGIFVINVLIAVLAVNITVQRELDADAEEEEADIKSIEQSLLSRRLLSEKFGAEDISKQRAYIRFIKRHQISLRDSMEMRLILSYERMNELPGYSMVSSKEYERLLEKHAAIYPEWRRLITPVLDPSERIAASKREQQRRDERRIWEKRQAVLSGGSTLSQESMRVPGQRKRQEDLTPPFILEELRATQEEARLRLRKAALTKRNQFRRLDSYVDTRASWFGTKFKEINEDGYAGEKDNATWIQKWCYKLVSQWWFDTVLMNFIIVCNVLALSTVHYNAPDWVWNMLYVTDILFAAIFLLEMVVKMIGFGFLKYITDFWCAFDGLIALLSLIQFAGTGGPFVSAFRAIRLLRLLRIIVRMNSMRRILEALTKTVKVIIPFTFIVLFFLFGAAIMSLHLFGGILTATPEEYDCSPSYRYYPHCPPRSHFDGFFFAFVTSFQVLTKENWNEIMYRIVDSSSYWSFLWFFGVIFIGSIVVLNIFLGVLIDSFLDAAQQRKVKEFNQSNRNLLGSFGIDRRKTEEVSEDHKPESNPESREPSSQQNDMAKRRSLHRMLSRGFQPELQPTRAMDALKEYLELQKKRQQKLADRSYKNHASYPFKTFFGRIHGDNPVRYFIGTAVRSYAFNYFIVTVIVISSIALCFESARVPPELRVKLDIINDFVAAVFLAEMVLKMFAFGVFGHPGAYFRDRWNYLNFTLVLFLFISLVVQGYDWVRFVYMARAFYPLRVVRHVEGFRAVVTSLLRAARPVLDVGIFVCLFYLAVAILGTLLFQGSFYSCYGGPTTEYNRIPQDELCFKSNPHYNAPECLPHHQCNATNWLNPTITPGGRFTVDFDSVPRSLLVLFELSALENWFVPMYAAMDSVGIGQNFSREASRFTAFFFVFFVLFFNILLIQLFVAVVVDSFSQSEREAQARSFLTPRQYEWVRMQRRALRLPFQGKELAPRTEPFRTIHKVVTSKQYKRFQLLVTLFNIGVLLSQHADPTPTYVKFFDAVDYVVGSIYTLDVILKFVAFGLHQFLRSSSSILDLSVVTATIIGWAIPRARNAVQMFDAFKAFSVIYFLKDTKHLLSTLMLSAPTLLNVSALVIMVYYIYAIVGMTVFSNIRDYPPRATGKFVVLDDYVNFESFGTAFITLFRMSTGENWNGIMRDMVSSSSVHHSNFALVFCVSFILIIQFCLLNLVIAVIMFDITDEIENNAKGRSSNITVSSLVGYAKAWADVRYNYEKRMRELEDQSDPEQRAYEEDVGAERTCLQQIKDIWRSIRGDFEHSSPQTRMPCTELANLVMKIPPPLGLHGIRNITRADTLRVIRALEIPLNAKGEIHYHTTLTALIDRVVLGDAIHKTLKESVIGADRKPVFDDDPEAKGLQLFDRVTEELQELLHLQIPRNALAYRQVLEQETTTRDDGYDAAHLIATRLLHKAAARFLQRKKDMKHRSLQSGKRKGNTTKLAGSPKPDDGHIVVTVTDQVNLPSRNKSGSVVNVATSVLHAPGQALQRLAGKAQDAFDGNSTALSARVEDDPEGK